MGENRPMDSPTSPTWPEIVRLSHDPAAMQALLIATMRPYPTWPECLGQPDAVGAVGEVPDGQEPPIV